MVPERREEKLTGKDKKTAKIKRSQVIPRHMNRINHARKQM